MDLDCRNVEEFAVMIPCTESEPPTLVAWATARDPAPLCVVVVVGVVVVVVIV